MGLTKKQLAMLAVLISGSFITILNQTLVSPALPTIMYDMSVGAATVQWLTTGFNMVNAIMIPVTAYLTDRFRTRDLFCVSVSIFTVGTVLCALGIGFPMLLAGRIVQAIGAGVLMPMVLTVLLLTFPAERRGFAMGLFGIVIMFAPALGPTAAGIIIDRFDWHIMFWIVTALAAVDVFIALFVIAKEDKPIPDDLHLDKLSVLESTVGFGCLLYGFSVIGNYGVNIPAVASAAVGAVVCVLFFHRQLKLERPMLEVRVLKNRRFLTGTVIGMIIQASIVANAVLVPIYVQTICGQSATVSGLVLLPAAVIMGVMSPVSGMLFDRHGPRALAVAGLALFATSTLLMVFFNASMAMWVAAAVLMLRNFSMSLVNNPLNTWSMNALENRLINHGNAVNNTLRQASGSLGTALVVSVYSLVSGWQGALVGSTQALMLGFRAAYLVQLVLALAALVLGIVMVKDKPGDLVHSDPADKNRTLLEGIMHTDVFTISSSATVADAIKLLLDKDVSAVPVVNDRDEVCGFLSDGDIIRALSNRSTAYFVDPVSSALATAHVDSDLERHATTILASPVSAIATSNCITADIHEDISAIARTMGDNHIKKMPITSNGVITGVVNRSDITQAVLETYLRKRAEMMHH